MAAKKTKAKPVVVGPKDDFLRGWSEVIHNSGDRMRERSAQTREDNKTRADAIQDLPLDDIFHEVATQTTSPIAPILREMIEEGPKNGMRETPDPLTVALVRAAHFWYVAAKKK